MPDPRAARAGGQLRSRLQGPRSHRQNAPGRRGKNFAHPRHRRQKRERQKNPRIALICRHTAINPISKNFAGLSAGPADRRSRARTRPARRLTSSNSRPTKIRSARRRSRWPRCKKLLARRESLSRRQRVLSEAKARGKTRRRNRQISFSATARTKSSNSSATHCWRPATNVVVSQYCFAIYPIVAKMFGANVITVPAKNYGHDLPAMLKAITPQTRIVFVANPNNPTGTLASREEVIRIRERSSRRRAAGDGRGLY